MDYYLTNCDYKVESSHISVCRGEGRRIKSAMGPSCRQYKSIACFFFFSCLPLTRSIFLKNRWMLPRHKFWVLLCITSSRRRSGCRVLPISTTSNFVLEWFLKGEILPKKSDSFFWNFWKSGQKKGTLKVWPCLLSDLPLLWTFPLPHCHTFMSSSSTSIYEGR